MTVTMISILVIILSLIGIPIVLMGIMYQVARTGKQLAYVRQNHIMYIMKGDSVSREIINVPGYKRSDSPDQMDRHWIIPGNPLASDEDIHGGEIGRWLRENFGIIYVSILYPLRKVWEFEVSVRKLKERHPSTIGDGEAWIEDEGKRRVSGLLFEVVRPIIVQGVELPGDGSQINVVFQAQFVTICPYVPTFVFNGGHYPLLEEMVKSSFVEFCATHEEESEPLRYNSWLSLKKGPNSDFYKKMMSINCSEHFLDGLDPEKRGYLEGKIFQNGRIPTMEDAGKGYIEVFGLAMTNISLIGWEAAGMAEIAEAKKKIEKNKLLAEAAIEEAHGSSEAIRMNKVGEGLGISSIVEEVKKKNPHLSDSEIWAGVSRMLQKEKLPRGITTYVEGNQDGEGQKPNILL